MPMVKPSDFVFTILVITTWIVTISMLAVRPANAHCDTLDGPVVQAARSALESGDVTLVFQWVQPADEPEIRQAFEKAEKVRGLGEESRQLADLYFFETLVRVHRAGEGVAYTGLKPAGATDPGIAAADRALEDGSVDVLADELGRAVAAAVRERFAKAYAAQGDASHSVEAGRGFVAAYVEYIHFVEALHALATAPSASGAERHHGAGE